jgi:hypothetical protein
LNTSSQCQTLQGRKSNTADRPLPALTGTAGLRGAVRAGVTVLTVDPIEAGVVLVAEGDRLHRAGRFGILRGSVRETGLARRPRDGELGRDLVRDLMRRRDLWGATSRRCRLPAP